MSSEQSLDELALLEELGAEISSAPDGLLNEGSYSREQVQEFSEQSLDFLAALAMPDDYVYQYPLVLLAVWDWLRGFAGKTRDFSKLALGIPRGFSKTTLIKLFLVYCVLFTKKQFIFVICATAPKAQALIADVADMLDQQNVKRTFGDWRLGLIKDTQEVKQFTFRGRTVILAADGAQGKGIRGLNLKNKRPDIIVFDDIQTREDAESETESEKIYRWMLGTAMKAKAYSGCLYIFIANMYPFETSILRKLKKNPNWIKFITGGILEDGSSLWEDLQPVEQLIEEYNNDEASGHPEIFLSEVMNDEDVNVLNSIDTSKIVSFPGDLSQPPDGRYIIIDPATGKPGSNNVAIGNYAVYDRKSVLLEIKADQYSPLDSIKQALAMCARDGTRAIFIEAAAYQATFLFWFEFICNQLNIVGIHLIELNSRTPKNIRIRDGYKKLVSKDIFVAEAVRPVIVSRFKQWNPLKKNNADDELDLIGYADKPLHEHWEMLQYDLLFESSLSNTSRIEEDYELSSPF